MIRMKRFSRSSRPTGPKMRVPRGSPPSLIRPAAFFPGTYHDPLDDVALLDASPGQRVLDGRHDDVTDARVSPATAAEHADAQDLLGTRVVGDLEPRLLLDHVNSCFVTPVCSAGDSSLLLLGSFENLGNAPPLGGGERPGLHQQYAVTD